jgi:hypothetical protein
VRTILVGLCTVLCHCASTTTSRVLVDLIAGLTMSPLCFVHSAAPLPAQPLARTSTPRRCAARASSRTLAAGSPGASTSLIILIWHRHDDLLDLRRREGDGDCVPEQHDVVRRQQHDGDERNNDDRHDGNGDSTVALNQCRKEIEEVKL